MFAHFKTNSPVSFMQKCIGRVHNIGEENDNRCFGDDYRWVRDQTEEHA